MAEWGKGDPRWIVEERPDATNVNNWHWTEKNATQWSKDKLKALLQGMVLKKPGLGEVKINEVSDITGEATANNRKGKLIFFYELCVKTKWSADLEDPDAAEVSGSLNIPNLSEEFKANELDVDVSIEKGGSSGQKVKDFLRKEGTVAIQEKMADYITSLREEYATDLILPTAHSKAPSTAGKTLVTKKDEPAPTLPSVAPLEISSKQQDLKLTATFKCRVEELYMVFVEPKMVAAFTRSEPQVDPRVGGAFSLFGGNITGVFDVMETNAKLVQRWRFRDWPEGHYSVVTLKFTEERDQTKLSVTQTGVPQRDYDKTKGGWHHYYFESIKRTFGFGATLM